MKELEKVIVEAERARAAGKSAAIATVVDIQGSGYRLPGARMLIVDGRWTAGSISGGCLEEDVVLRAAEAIKSDRAVVATYDTTNDDDIVFGVGLGCKGIVKILIEPVRPSEAEVDFLSFVRSCLEQRTVATVAVVVDIHGQVQARMGDRSFVSHAGVHTSNIGDIDLNVKVQAALERFSISPSDQMTTIPLRAGSARVFMERIDPPTPLVVFGAGHDAIPLVHMAKVLGWHVTVVDHRTAYATAARFPEADRILVATPEQMSSRVVITEDTLAIVMTHNYLRDRKLVESLLATPSRYIGLLGPRKRVDEMLAEIRKDGNRVGPHEMRRLHAPVGLDIGSESPAEVALSILAEMQAVMSNRAGGFLKDRQAPIHGRAIA